MPSLADRVLETSTTTGTGNFTLAGAITGFRSWATAYPSASSLSVYYCIEDGTNWEVGTGAYTQSTGILVRSSVQASSNSNAAVSFPAGTKRVFNAMTAAFAASAVVTDSNGNVGIGVSPPVATLDVQAANVRVFATSTTGTNSAHFRSINTGGGFYMGIDTSAGGITGTNYANMLWNVGGTGPIVFGINGAEKARINSSSQLGVGIVPTQSLHVLISTPAATPTWSASDVAVFSATSNAVVQLHAGATGGTLGYAFASASARSKASLAYNPASDYLTLNTNSTERVRIDTSGQVGVGITPGYKLQVAGSGSTGIIAATSTDGSGGTTFVQANSSTDGRVGTITSVPLLLLTNSTERMRLDSAGNLGIGVVPQGWNTAYKALEIGGTGGGVLWGSTSDFYIGSNFYYSATPAYTRINAAATSMYRQNAGIHSWFGDASGSAGGTFTPTQRMALSAAGALTVSGAFGVNGATAQTAAASGGAVATTAPTLTTPYGYTTSAQALAIITAINNIRAALVANGIMS